MKYLILFYFILKEKNDETNLRSRRKCRNNDGVGLKLQGNDGKNDHSSDAHNDRPTKRAKTKSKRTAVNSENTNKDNVETTIGPEAEGESRPNRVIGNKKQMNLTELGDLNGAKKNNDERKRLNVVSDKSKENHSKQDNVSENNVYE